MFVFMMLLLIKRTNEVVMEAFWSRTWYSVHRLFPQ